MPTKNEKFSYLQNAMIQLQTRLTIKRLHIPTVPTKHIKFPCETPRKLSLT